MNAVFAPVAASTDWLGVFLEKCFSPLLGVVFLLTKLGTRWVTRRLAGREFDTRDALAWFGVDIAVLSLSLWIGLRLPAKFSFKYEQTVVTYFMLVAVVLFTAFAYRQYLRFADVRATDATKAMPFSVGRFCATIVWTLVGLVAGFSVFVGTVRRL